MIKKGVWEVEGAAFWCHILRPGTLMSLITHELFLLPRLRKRRHYHKVSVLCGVPPPPLECPTVFLLYTKSGLEKGVSALSLLLLFEALSENQCLAW